MSFRVCFTALLMAGTVLSTHAEQEKNATRSVRLLAVGDAPPFRQEVRDGVRYELEPPPFSIPPREIIAVADEKTSAATALRLGQISEPLTIPQGGSRLLLRDAADAGTPWHELGKPADGDFLTLFWRKPGSADWREVSHLILPDGPVANPAGTVSIVNVFPQTLLLKWGAETITLRPAARIQRKLAPGLEMPFQVIIRQPDGSERRYFSTTVSCRENERGWIVLHRADGAKPRRPLKVLVLREPL